MRQAILIFSIRIGDIGLGFLKFGLAEFDDGAEAEIVAGLRQVEGQSGLLAQLLSDGKALVGACRVLPGSTDVACNVIAKAGKFLTSGLNLEIGGLGARVEEKAVENRDVDIHADGAIPIGDMVVANRSFADNAERGDGRTPQVMFGTAKLLRRLDLVLKRENFRALLQSLLNERKKRRWGPEPGVHRSPR